MKKKTLIICLVAVLAVLIVLGGIVLSKEHKSKPSYAARIQKAEKYIEMGDYENAILEYQAAIDMDSSLEDAYIGLATVYIAQNRMDFARQVMLNGVQNTGSEHLMQELSVSYPELVSPSESNPDNSSANQDGGQKQGSGEEHPVVDVDLLQFISGATYQDYMNRYSGLSGTMEGGQYLIHVDQLFLTLAFYDTATTQVINVGTNRPYQECVPNEIRFDDVCKTFGVTELDYASLQTLQGITELKLDNGRISFTACGCKISADCDENKVIHAGASNSAIPSATTRITNTHTVSGVVLDATNGQPVYDAVVKIYAGYTAYGESYDDRTGGDGTYEITIADSGNFTAVVSKDGYVEETFSFYLPDSLDRMTEDFTISPVAGADEIRIVLTWGATPSDLDSYLIGTSGNGSDIFVCFHNMITKAGDKILAELDLDDTSSYGPETITIHDTSGEMDYIVVDYTGTTGVGRSGAEVKVYKGDQLLMTVTPPLDMGLGWRVVHISNGEVTLINQPHPTDSGSPKR